ncbi:hypothetical protein D9615_000750 [Tricholomella constricta]|uniref:Uncharacterized protein n=1 Tax=Tricholomella constricta TaxID=117010 RepID=A0A8H5MBC5_9AGAR|nr:hypothetical protein D9615_000750 [Tricholomella constricta]
MSTSNPARGRSANPKQLATGSTASTRARQAVSASSTRVNKSAKAPASSRSTSVTDTKPKANVAKHKPELSASTKAQTPAAPPFIEEKAPAPTSDTLQVAAQLYPWLYMTSTLEACFQIAEKDLAARSEHLASEESEISDQRIRFQAERTADFYDELSTDTFAETAPHLMQAFLAHGDACTRVEAEALHLATHGAREPDEDAPLRVYGAMLDSLEELHTEAVGLEASIVNLTLTTTTPESGSGPDPFAGPDPGREDQGQDLDANEGKNIEGESDADSSARTQIVGVFAACLPVLRARIANLSMAQELIDGAQENLSISLRMESLGLLD